ncbi:MAG: DUF99 family protein [Candidatus Aenigmatarchaeota archaeon]
MFRTIKPEIRILGWDDSPFKINDKYANVFGTIFRGGAWIDGLLKTRIKVDGSDATKKIIKCVNKTRHYEQLRVIMIDGITMAGFNVLDIKELFEKTQIPVIAISRKLPDFRKIRAALNNFSDGKKRWELIKKAGTPKPCAIRGERIYYQAAGIDDSNAKRIITLSCTRSLIPEPLRVAHLIASGVSTGESYGRA